MCQRRHTPRPNVRAAPILWFYVASPILVLAMPTVHASGASEKALRALELYDAAMATRTEEALDAYVGCFHDRVELTVACSGMAVVLSGLAELRAAMENLFAAGLSYACHDARVVSEKPRRVVAHYIRVLSQDGTPLSEVEAENELVFEGDLIYRMTIRERGRPADAPVVWAPLVSRPSFTG